MIDFIKNINWNSVYQSIMGFLVALTGMISPLWAEYLPPEQSLSDVPPAVCETPVLEVDRGLENMLMQHLVIGSIKARYTKGLCVHAPSTLTWDISEKRANKFRSYIGMNAEKQYDGITGTCEFIVLADGAELYRSPVMTAQTPRIRLDLDIPAGVRQLTLQTTEGGDGAMCDHGLWGDAKILFEKSARGDFDTLFLTPNGGALPVGGSVKMKADAMLIGGKALTLTKKNASLQYRSENLEIAQVTADGAVTAIAPGTAKILCTAEYKGMQRTTQTTLVVTGADTQSSWSLTSPDGALTAAFFLGDAGRLFYSVNRGAETVLSQAGLGLVTSQGDFTKDLTFADAQRETVRDSYELIGAKVSQVDAEGAQLTLSFTQGDAAFRVIARAYPNGFALRYAIETPQGGQLSIRAEQTDFTLPYGAVSQAMPYLPNHETAAIEKELKDLAGSYNMPLLSKTPQGSWILLNEAALNGEYCGTRLIGHTDGRLTVSFPSEQYGDVQTTAPFTSPWRYAVIGTPAAIAENTLAETLSPPCTFDTSWVKPGAASWTWLCLEPTDDFETYKRYIDLSAEMNWPYILLDAGWEPYGARGYGGNTYYPWTQELIDYANSKNVGILVWAYAWNLDTPEKQEVLREWAEMGIKGIKPDFFDSQSQGAMQLYDRLLAKTAEEHLLMNPHGANKPTGERRSYPQSMNREGVPGMEQEMYTKSYLSAKQNCLLPFTRGAVGPMDFTPTLSHLNVQWPIKFTLSHLAALPIIYDCGTTSMGDHDTTYLNSPAKSLLQGIPTSWDETRLLEGEPGEYVTMAKRAGENWYVGMICNRSREVKLSLDFLAEGKYKASIYRDGIISTQILTETKTVTAADTLNLHLARTGGASVKLEKLP